MGHPLRSLNQWQMAPGRPPYDDESLNGYIAHRAAAEWLPTAFVITSLADVQYGHKSELVRGADGLKNVADCLQADLADLQSRVYPLHSDGRRRLFFGAPIERMSIEHYTRRFSPTSLRKCPYHRAVWSLRPLPFCVESGELLQDRCPFCDKTQRWLHTNGIDNCDFCGSSLLDAAPVMLPDALLENLSFVAALINPDPTQRAMAMGHLPEQVRAIGIGPAFDLLVAIAGVADPAIRSTRPRRSIRTTADRLAICHAMASAWGMLRSWPSSFEDSIAARLGRREGRFDDGNAGATQDFFEFAGATTFAPPVRKLIVEVRGRLTNNRATGLDAKEAAAVTGLKVKRIVSLRREGILPTVFHLDGDRPHPLINKEVAQKLSDQLRSSTRIEDAAIALGISYHGVEQLLCMGSLCAIHPFAGMGYERDVRVDAASLEQFIDGIDDRPTARPEINVTPLGKAMTTVAGLKPWGPILTSIAGGSLTAYSKSRSGALCERLLIQDIDVPKLGSFVFDRGRHAEFPFSPTMTKKDATAALNLHLRHSTPLFAQWPATGGCGDRAVPLSEVERLAAAYVSSAELGALTGLNSKAAVAAAERAGLERVSPAGFDRRAVIQMFGHDRDS